MAIIQNALKITENNKVNYILSRHRHDLVSYKFECGDDCFIDGGNSYLRRGYPHNENLNKCIEEWSLNNESNLDEIKSKLLWGTYGIDGNSELKYIPLSECEEEHLNNIIRNCHDISILYRDIINSILSDKYKKEDKR